MPNGAQASTEEGEASGGESQEEEEWDSDVAEDDDDDDDDVDDDSLVNAMICGAMSSVSNVCIIPVQDYLNYGAGYRMNVPSTVGDNWTFRLKPGKMTKKIWKQIAELTKTYGRFQ